jgi:tRNA (cmo5U34)-methyltransferase
VKIPEAGSWTFNSAEIANSFDAHVREQLPWYEIATASVAHIARHYVPQGGVVYDIGASTGNIGRALEDTLTARGATFYPVEASKEMAARYAGPGAVKIADATGMDFKPFDFGVVFLCLIFMPPHLRGNFLNRMIAALRPGGAIVVVERMEQGAGYPATISARLTLSNKLLAGATPDDIIRKELSLSGTQRPMRLTELPKNAVEFFRMGDFAGWIIEAKG